MRRSCAAMATTLILMTISLMSGCFDTGPVYLPTGAQCGGTDYQSADVCEGGVCLGIPPNQQNMAGFCSADCTTDENCTPHELCVSIQGQARYCMRACQSDDDCYDAFVCRIPNPGATQRICLIDIL